MCQTNKSAGKGMCPKELENFPKNYMSDKSTKELMFLSKHM